jgi:glycosyltransferase involved in cell wall biosynthesis
MANCHAGFVKRAFPELPVIATMRTGKKLPWLYRRSLCAADAVIANSHAAARVLETSYKVPPQKISVIYNAPVFLPDAPHKKPPPPASATANLLCVAMLRPEKNHRALIEIAARLPQNSDWRLTLAGEGAELAACKKLAERLLPPGRIQFTGFQADPRPLYRAARVAVLASKKESLPNFLVEAHLHGLPSVAFEAGGVAECGGITIAPGDTARFASEVSRLLLDPRHHAAESARVRAFAEAHFSRKAWLDAHIALFTRLIAR